MARIAGINIPLHKHVVIALSSIYGIGSTRANQVCDAAGVAKDIKVKDLSEIMQRGVMMTPALVIDGEVKAVGKIPGEEAIKKILNEASA